MKKIYLVAAMALLAAFSKAQSIPNGGFENWTTTGNYSDPNGWYTLNSELSTLSVVTVEKGTPGASGNSYAKVITKDIGGDFAPGFLLLGKITSQDELIPGMAINTKPPFLIGKYQAKITAGDTAMIMVQLTKWNSSTNDRDLVGMGALSFGNNNTTTWTNFTVNLDYDPTNIPDSAAIIIMLGKDAPVANDFISVDDLAFSNNSASINNAKQAVAQIYPNPSNGNFVINSSITMSNIQITNILGEIIFTQNLKGNSAPIALNNLAAGIYIYTIQTTDNQLITGKISIN